MINLLLGAAVGAVVFIIVMAGRSFWLMHKLIQEDEKSDGV